MRLSEQGFKITGIAEFSCGLHNPNGIDIKKLFEYKAANSTIQGFPGARSRRIRTSSPRLPFARPRSCARQPSEDQPKNLPVFAPAAPQWATTQDALALLQHEMERQLAETLFGAENLFHGG